MNFEWDSVKAETNRAKHGISFEEALTVFADRLARILNDPDHSVDERREIIIGHSVRHRLLLLSFVEREGAIRIISARPATRSERDDYEKKF
jgi:uncharacterized DUF497 family protein